MGESYYKKQIFNIIGCNQTFKKPDPEYNCSISSSRIPRGGGSSSRSSSSSSSSSESTTCCPEYICCSSSSSSSREDFCNCGDSRFPDEPVGGDDISPRGPRNWSENPTCCRCAIGWWRINPAIDDDCGKGPYNTPCDNNSCVSQPADWAGSLQSHCREAHSMMEWHIASYYWCNGGRQPNTPNTADQFICAQGVCICKPMTGFCKAPCIINVWENGFSCVKCDPDCEDDGSSSSTDTSSTSTSSSSFESQPCTTDQNAQGHTGEDGGCCSGAWRDDFFTDKIGTKLEIENKGKEFMTNSDIMQIKLNGYLPILSDISLPMLPLISLSSEYLTSVTNALSECNSVSKPCWCNNSCSITIEEQKQLYIDILDKRQSLAYSNLQNMTTIEKTYLFNGDIIKNNVIQNKYEI